jgi:probable rRNA maturation factor
MGSRSEVALRLESTALRAHLDVDIVRECGEWQQVPGLEPSVIEAAARAYAATGLSEAASVAIALLDDATVRRLNRQFRGTDKPTNVLSFSAPAGKFNAQAPRPLGDIALAHGTIVREAAEQGISLLDHVRHLVVHGMLHLAGYDHETDAEADAMEALETRILMSLGVVDPYAGTAPADAARTGGNLP